MKPRVKTNPLANRYTAKNERIIEFSAGGKATGGLISIMEHDDGTVSIQLYRLDPMVVTVSFDGNGKAKATESGKGLIITPA